MANPAPTINQINAFNATQGTTIDFNIIGGTELVRSNRIYIYDLSDNSLICTHLYVSTESIHELPPNTDGSIVYEDGKSSADFVNGAQYYAQIQTFTDIAGTEGGSGLSVAKMFWCLVDPTLTITTIPSTISTTSYNVSATYNANTSVVSNIIQQYQFSLYSATGSLLQSSGVVVGSGTQQGTSTAYDISYNFSGLSVGSSYYVVVDVTTTQGMSVSAQSGTFTVSIDTPTLGEATVVNNACDGYISVTSNLSSEYGGSGSGEIVSFETDSENVFTKLQVDLDPLQDLNGYDAPWVGGAGKNKWEFNSSYSGNGYLAQNLTFTVPIASGTYTFSCKGTIASGGAVQFRFIYDDDTTYDRTLGYYVSGGTYYLSFTFEKTVKGVSFIYSNSASNAINDIQLESGSSFTTYAPYENICPISGHTEVVVEHTGVNVWDEEWEVGLYYGNTGLPNPVTGRIRSKNINPITVLPNTNYYIPESISQICWYDASDNFIISAGNPVASVVTSPTNARYMRFHCSASYGAAYNNDISINYPSTDHDYRAYNGQSYATQLGQTVYGGTLDVVSGLLTVTHQYISDFSNIAFGLNGRATNFTEIYTAISPTKANGIDNIISNMLETGKYDYGGINGRSGNGNVYFLVPPSIETALEGKQWLIDNGVTICYELATPQTYQLTPQQIQTLVGQNNVWSEDGEISLAYHIPITNLLVKRQDVADVSGDWLTLYSQPITQASDMDFTFIDFTNQYGKTYKYALVPLLTQTQSGVEVEVEGGYTVSDEVQSVFDGVFIVDSTGSQKCKANVGYGNVDMNQTVGTITPIGAKYPVVITNSKNQYHNGSIYGTIVPDDYYFNGNLSRIDMVNKRDELEQFLTNKRAKIIKDWNGKIWLVMIMDNVNCTFNNNYGMGIVNFNTNWVEVGDPTNQQDLQATGLINVGGA